MAAWLERAANLSGDGGPIFRTSLKEILEKKPDWDRRESHTLQLLRDGVAPMFLAAQTLNRSLMEVLSLPYLANLSEPDPRKRTSIPAFSAKRSVQNAEISGVVGLEATSLLTLGALDLLDAFAGSVDAIRIPHSTLAPPFYRRMAAFAQSALVLRGIRESSADAASLCTWSRKNCTGQFYLQSLADMRLEPRWYPDLLQASQLKAEVCGRLILAGHGAEKDLPPRLADLLLLTSTHSDSLKMKIHAPGFFFPGPLEGATDYRRDLPEALRRAIDEQIGASELGANSFIALVNSVDMFSIVDDIPERVSEVLRNGRYHLHHLKDHAQLMIVLLGLARVAAVCRSTSLAHELKVLVRRYRHDAQFTLSLDDAFRVILFAAAAFTDLIEWAKFVGDNLRELAFSEVSEEDAATLHSQMHVLCVAVPELWIAVGRADAALASINS